jgi:hypothetical protein
MAFEWLTKAFSSSAAKKPEDMAFDEARPAFFNAIKNADLDALTAFTKKFPDALQWENEKGTSLYIALKHKQLGAFQHLVGLGADINSVASGKDCLLQIAAETNKKDFVQFMLEQGVVNVGYAEDYARGYKNFDIADMIKRKDIIRAEYLAQNSAPVPTVPQASLEVATETKIEVLSPVQLRKTAETNTP